MVVETLKLGIAILNGGNAGVQQVRWHRGMVQSSWGTSMRNHMNNSPSCSLLTYSLNTYLLITDNAWFCCKG